jgi:hypothetical protein
MKLPLRRHSNKSNDDDDKNGFNVKDTFETMKNKSVPYSEYKKMLRHTIYIPEYIFFDNDDNNHISNTDTYLRKNIFGNKNIDHIVIVQDCNTRGSYFVYFWMNKKNNKYYHTSCCWVLQDILGDYETLTKSSRYTQIGEVSYQIKYTGILTYTISLSQG